MADLEPRLFLKSLFDAAITAAKPKPEWFEGLEPPPGRVVVIGAGKAAASMAQPFEVYWNYPVTGLVVTRYGHAAPTSQILVVEAAHPVPDQSGVDAARQILELVTGLTPDDLVVSLISGGGSSLLTLPAENVTLQEKQRISGQLLRSGASISEINAVRKALSRIKGGRLLLAAQPARVITYVLSDVPADDPSIVASGPTVPDKTAAGEAQRVMARYGISVSHEVKALLTRPAPALESANWEVKTVASAQISLKATARKARELGVAAHVLSDSIQSEARNAAVFHAEIARYVARTGEPFTTPCVLLSGGETTVTVRGSGRGGRNVEFLAALAQSLDGCPGIYALAADTDGIDGSEPIAGAFIDPTTVQRAGEYLPNALANNDAHSLFESLGDQLVTGPTLTNVNDFRAILIR